MDFSWSRSSHDVSQIAVLREGKIIPVGSRRVAAVARPATVAIDENLGGQVDLWMRTVAHDLDSVAAAPHAYHRSPSITDSCMTKKNKCLTQWQGGRVPPDA